MSTSAIVLIIDDDQSFRLSVAQVLAESGYQVLQAGDAKSAYDLLERLREQVNVVIVDLALPGISGFEVIGLLEKRAPQMKVIATSAIYKPPYLEVALELGAHLSMPKPTDPNEWVRIVSDALAASSAANG
jgi:two-component system, NtrC family, C4-dicarboxylate transport response regulator DctD